MSNRNTSLLSSHVDFSADFISTFLSPKKLAGIARSLGIGYRRRCVYTPGVVILMWISSISLKLSGRRAVAHENMSRVKRKKRAVSPSDAGFSKAKTNLSLKFIQAVSGHVLEALDSQSSDKWQWKHGGVKGVDGTGVSIEDTHANLKRYSRQNNLNRDCGYCVGRILAFFDLGHGGLQNFSISNWKGKAAGEMSLLQALWHHVKKGETLLGDAGFCAYSVFAQANRLQAHVVVELLGRMAWRLNKKKAINSSRMKNHVFGQRMCLREIGKNLRTL